MTDNLAAFQTSRMIYATSDFYSAGSPEDLYAQLEQVFWELLGRSSYTLLFPEKIENRLKAGYSTYFAHERWDECAFDLEGQMLQSLLDHFNRTGILITDDPKVLGQWPFPVHYCAVMKDGLTILGLILVHEGPDETIDSPLATLEILEPIVKHFAQALLRQKSEQQVEKLLDETNAKLLAINEIGELLGHLDLDTLLSKIMALALQMTRAEVGSLMYRESEQLASYVEWGLTDEVINGIKWRDGSPLAQRVLEHHMPVLVEQLSTDNRFVTEDSSRQIQSLVSLPLYTTSKDLGVLNVVNTHGGESFSPENMATLQTVTSLASTAIENAILHKEAIEREVFREQLRIARQIWEYILPRKIPAFPGATIGAKSEPASVVGGDFYDFIPLGENRLGLVIADVSGKGIPAAMVMNMAKSVLHIEALRGHEPREVLQIVNNILVDSTRMDSFVTLIYAVFDAERRRVTMTNAGHNPCLIYRQGSRSCESFPSDNMPLAIVPDVAFSQVEFELNPGDGVVFYTDGVTEAMDRKREMYELERLENLIASTEPEDTAEIILNRIFQSVQQFAGDMPQHDDTTVLVFRMEPAGA